MSSIEVQRQHYNVTFTLLAAAAVSYALLQSLVAPALLTIQHDLNTTPTGAAWILTAYLLSASVVTPIAGRLGDMYGKKLVMVVVLIVLALGTALAGLASSIEVMIVARVIQGAGGAIFPLSFAIIRDEFPPERVPQGIALISAILGIGGGLGIVLAGPIVEHFSYHWLFWFPLIAVVIAIVGIVVFVPESPVRARGRIDPVGAVLLSALARRAAGRDQPGLELGLDLRQDARALRRDGGADPGVDLVGVAQLLAGRRHEDDAPARRLDDEPRRAPVRLRHVLVVHPRAAVRRAVEVDRLRLRRQCHAGGPLPGSRDRSGCSWPGRSRAVSRARSAPRCRCSCGSLVSCAGFVILAVAHDSDWQIYLAMAVMGIGIGFAFASMANLIVEAVPAEQTGVATGMNTIVRTIGGAIGSTVAAGIIDRHAGGERRSDRAGVHDRLRGFGRRAAGRVPRRAGRSVAEREDRGREEA